MNNEEYREQLRRQIEEELAQQPALAAAAASDAPPDPEPYLQILGDANRSAEERRAALVTLQQLSFNVPLLAEFRPAFIETLRAIIDDPDERLRDMALESLAQEKDEYAQRRLLAGLRRDEEPLVSDKTAIQFLSYDIHAEHFPILRRLARESPDAATRREAVHALAADTESADLLLAIYADKNEDDEVRSASGSALLAVDPLRFEERAKETVIDDSDAESVRAASLTALTYYGNPSALAEDADFMGRVAQVDTRGPALSAAAAAGAESDDGTLAKAVRMFQSRYGVR